MCVHHSGGALYKATKCKKHDKELTWNKRGPQGPKGNNGTNGTNGAVAGYSTSKPGPVDFTSTTQGSPQTILTESLPAGSFIVTAKTEPSEVASSSGFASATCNLTDGSTTDAAQMYLQMGSLLQFTGETTLPLGVPVSSSSPSTATLTCWGLNSGSSPTFDALNSDIDAVQTSANH